MAAIAQDSDVELRSLLGSGSGLELKQLSLPSSKRVLYCDISTGKARPYVPEKFRCRVFEMLHGLSHPGVKATTNLIKQRFVWKSVNKDVQEWCKFCIPCQESKIHRHTKSPLGLFKLPNARFNHVHIDVVGPLLLSKGYNFVLTCIYRFSRWPEAFLMCNQLAETVAQTMYTGWISRFGLPEIITSDRGTNFE
ncbi:hypothetical protein AVEN_76911-1 [Araneus ventricosus]|uniref:RNA-directed DNA polymerase n=1 Tax=Araneus ventricosus TaxID=182803 RepID=A0A4Y2KPT2_ARAVE|nr:hypothetical protein AVEN_61139-1 [Araneus ventricosus]GBN04618.1 hypothetical protein AVEN_68192-1 [Araneus ventricosus]GBN04624.1 hypothetical protein AVEN_71816-1 [Araneus ventricosus]GBN04630.1 hypothetical protein AVEN_76911-1 [Araneus ventricosus]